MGCVALSNETLHDLLISFVSGPIYLGGGIAIELNSILAGPIDSI
jgi:hypothetical protein